MSGLYRKIVFLGFFFIAGVSFAQNNINGLEYILQKRPKRDSLPADRWVDHVFLSGAIGAEGVINGIGVRPGRNRIGMNAAFYAGKWFNSASALRLGVQVGLPQHQLVLENHSRRYFLNIGVTADYMFHLSNYVVGYNPQRIVNFIPFVGAGLHSSLHSADMKNASASLRFGLYTSFKLSKGLDFFIEPTLRFYTDDYNFHDNWRGYDMVPTMMAGLTYSFVPRSLGRNLIPFNNERLFQHMFFSFGLGGSMVLRGSSMNKQFYKNLGPEFFMGFGNWFTATSGARLSAFGNIYRLNNKYISLYGGQLDYLLNLDALFEGYNPDRFFRLFAVAGLNLAFPEQLSNTATTFGFGVGFQANMRMSPSIDFFVEPRLNYYPNKFVGGMTHPRFDMPATVLLGFTYKRPDNRPYNKGEFKDNKIQDHLFISAGVGILAPIAGFAKSLRRDAVQPTASFSAGKWFSPRSALRLQANAGLLGELNSYGKYARTKYVGLDLDYMLDLSNLLVGYDPGRRFSLRGFVGPTALFNTATDRKSPRGFVFGGNGGLQGVARLSDFCQLYIEPKLSLYSDKLVTGYLPPLRGDLVASLTAGVIYNFRTYDLPASQHKFETSAHKKWFASVGGGIGTTIRSSFQSWHRGPAFQASFGKDYSPLSSWRLGLGYSSYPTGSKKAPDLKYLGLEADYMLDLSTLTCGYESDRFFIMKGFAGLSFGKLKYRNDNMFSPGIHVGVQPSFRINPQFSLFMEPRVNFYSRKMRTQDFLLESSVTVLGGVIWRFNL